MSDHASDPEKSGEQPRRFAEVMRERVDAVRAAQAEFIKTAREGGIPEAQIAAVVADAINTRTLPAVLLSGIDRNGAVQVQLLDGQIPLDALGVRALDDQEAERLGHVYLQRRPEERDAFGVRTTRPLDTVVIPGLRPQPLDPAVMADLGRIDEHFAPGTFDVPRVIEPVRQPPRDDRFDF